MTVISTKLMLTDFYRNYISYEKKGACFEPHGVVVSDPYSVVKWSSDLAHTQTAVWPLTRGSVILADNSYYVDRRAMLVANLQIGVKISIIWEIFAPYTY